MSGRAALTVVGDDSANGAHDPSLTSMGPSEPSVIKVLLFGVCSVAAGVSLAVGLFIAAYQWLVRRLTVNGV